MKRTGTVDEGSLKDTDHSSHSCNVLKDLLMQKLGETISPERIDFIMVHFQHACTHCCKIIESGERWVCKQCKQFQLCRKCHNAEQKLDMRDRHPVNSREHHFLRLHSSMVLVYHLHNPTAPAIIDS